MPSRSVLLIAYHFPPIQGSTGASRTLAFSRYLRESGWDAKVLTIQTGAYEDTSSDNELMIPAHVSVERAWGLDTRRSLSIFGRYLQLLALPDRWQSWIIGGYLSGSRIVKRWKPDVIMSTYPIASAHVIGRLLSRKFRLPWIAEFRDPMLQPNYPSNAQERRAFEAVENLVFKNAARVIVTTDGCKQFYLDRFPNFDHRNILTISNGFDPAIFPDISPTVPDSHKNRLILLHSGLLYPHERNPKEFFHAIKSLVDNGFLDQYDVEFRFRASGNEDDYCETVKELGIDKYVKFLSRIPYLKAVEEMLISDALMIFQADNCNDQIPAKVYEYLYSQKPILGFADPKGETGRFLASVGVQSVAKLEDRRQIETEVTSFLRQLKSGSTFTVPREIASGFSRQSLTRDLGRVLHETVDQA